MESLKYLHIMQHNVYLARLLESLFIIIAGIIFIYIIRKIFEKISTTTGVDTRSVNNMYKLIKTATSIVIFFLVLYTLTQASVIVLFILGIILIMIAASWEVIANVAAYYVVLINRRIGKGDLIEIEYNNMRIIGRIREINPFFTTIESSKGVFSIPNLALLRYPSRTPGPTGELTINVRIWGVDDPDTIRSIVRRLEDEIAVLSRPIVPSPRHLRVHLLIDELSNDSVSLRVVIPLPSQEVNREKFNRLLEDLAVTLKETGYSFSISLPLPES